MNRKELLEETKNIVNDTDIDEQIDNIILTGMNHYYMHEMSDVWQNYKFSYVPVILGVGRLPDDCLEIIEYDPPLITGEFRRGNAILSKRNVLFRISYNGAREALLKDTDIPEIPEQYHYLLIYAGAMAYFNYRKKIAVSDWYKTLLDEEIYKIKNGSTDNEVEYVRDVEYGETI